MKSVLDPINNYLNLFEYVLNHVSNLSLVLLVHYFSIHVGFNDRNLFSGMNDDVHWISKNGLAHPLF